MTGRSSKMTLLTAGLAICGSADAGLVAYFPLNDGPAGSFANTIDDVIDDALHNVTDGTTNVPDAATWVNDAARGVVLNSPGNQRFLAGTQDIDMAEGFTWSLWAKVASSTSASKVIIGTRNGAWHKITPASGVDGSGFADFNYTGGLNLADDTWHHIAYRGSAALGKVEIFVDGVQVGEDTSVPATYDGQMEIGGSTRFSEYADVRLDDVAIWDHALEDNDILALFNGASPPSIPEPGSLALVALGGLMIARRRRH